MADDQKTSYKIPVLYVLIGEFCERFCYFGIRSVILMYMFDVLKFPESKLTACMNTFVIVTTFTPIIGGMIADSWLGKYKTIVIVTLVYMAGCFTLSWGTMETLNIWEQPSITYFGLAIVAVTAGMVKPCRAAFGGDQYQLPEQEIPFSRFFSWLVLVSNLGSVASRLVALLLGTKIKCLKNDTCYPLALGIPGILLVLSLFTYGTGFRIYNIVEQPDRNIFTNVFGCIIYALFMKVKNFNETKEHWLDYAEDKYDKTFIEDLKVLAKVFVIFAPLPLFWSLFEQQYTGWYYQARRMKGELGQYVIRPQDMQLANPILVVILIILFEFWFYPCLRRCAFGRPLQKMVVGGYLAAIAFFISGILSLEVEKQFIRLPQLGKTQVRIYNNLRCDINVTAPSLNEGKQFTINKSSLWAEEISVCGHGETTFSVVSECYNVPQGKWTLRDGEAMGYYFDAADNDVGTRARFEDDIELHPMGLPKVKFLAFHLNEEYWKNRELWFVGTYYHQRIVTNASDTSTYILKPDLYKLSLRRLRARIRIDGGNVYRVLFGLDNSQNWQDGLVTLHKPPDLHVLWQIPQYVFLTAGEVMFSVTGLEFAYSESPKSMKTTMVAMFMITYAFGKLIAVSISAIQLYEEESSYFFFYGALMIIDMTVFACISLRYKYVYHGNEVLLPEPSEVF